MDKEIKRLFKEIDLLLSRLRDESRQCWEDVNLIKYGELKKEMKK